MSSFTPYVKESSKFINNNFNTIYTNYEQMIEFLGTNDIRPGQLIPAVMYGQNQLLVNVVYPSNFF
jgi:hypothetical protein